MLQNLHLKVIYFVCLLIIAHFNRGCRGQGNKKNMPVRNYQQQQSGGGGPQIQNERSATAREMLKYMDSSVEPCEDFYDYACGNWLSFQNVYDAKEGDVISVINRLDRRINLDLQNMLQDPRAQTQMPQIQPMIKFYTTCLRTTRQEQEQFIGSFVAKNGGMPGYRNTWRTDIVYDWINVLALLKRNYNLDILIVLSNNNGRYVLTEPPNTILPAELCNSEAAQRMDEKAEMEIQMKIKENLRAWFGFGDTDATRLAGDIQTFEYSLCKYMRKESVLEVLGAGYNNSAMMAPTPYGPTTSIGVNMNNNMAANNPKLKRFVNMCLIANQSPGGLGGQQRGSPTSSNFEVRNEEYLQFLTSINGQTPSFALYIMYRAIAELVLPLNEPQAERKYFCVRKLMQLFPSELGLVYQTRFMQQRELIKKDIEDMFREIKAEMPAAMRRFVDALQLSEPQYLPPQQQQQSQYPQQQQPPPYQNNNGNYWQKLQELLKITALQSLTPAQQQNVRAQNAVESFSTSFAATRDKALQYGLGLLQPPFYSLNYPRSLKYASLGFVLARELVKIADQQKWDDRKPSQQQQQDKEFIANRECFRAQVSNYFFNTPQVYRNATQLCEMTADAGALGIAFKAYSTWLANQRNEPDMRQETLPGINLSNTQLFFLKYAQTRCAVRYTTAATTAAADIVVPAEFLPMDRRIAERLNVNGPLGNDLEFGRDFNCVIGSEMNFADKCSMFNPLINNNNNINKKLGIYG